MCQALSGWMNTVRKSWPLLATVFIVGCSNDGGSDRHTLKPSPVAGYYFLLSNSRTTQAGSLTQYAVHADGSMDSARVIPVGNSATAIAINPTILLSYPPRRFLYVANSGDKTISQFVIRESEHGKLEPLSPAAVSNTGMVAGGATNEIAIDPHGMYAYVLNGGDETISQFVISGDGTLLPMTPAFVNVSVPTSITIDPTGKYVYVTAHNILQAQGGLFVPGSAMSSIFQFKIENNGALTPLTPAEIVVAGASSRVVVDRKAKNAYILSDCVGTECIGMVSQYAIASDGTLAPVLDLNSQPVSVPLGSYYTAVDMHFDASSAHAFVLSNLRGIDTNPAAIFKFDVNADGSLSTSGSSGRVNAGMNAIGLANGVTNSLIVLNWQSLLFFPAVSGALVNTYAIDNNGTLTLTNALSIQDVQPSAMAVLPVPLPID